LVSGFAIEFFLLFNLFFIEGNGIKITMNIMIIAFNARIYYAIALQTLGRHCDNVIS